MGFVDLVGVEFFFFLNVDTVTERGEKWCDLKGITSIFTASECWPVKQRPVKLSRPS